MLKHVGILFVALAVFGCFLRAVPIQARGELVKGSLPAVYYVAEDGSRYVFPNERIYFSWYNDFAGVSVISDEELARYPIGGNVTYRAGTRLVKLTGDPRVYALEPGGVLRWIPTEEVARTLYGASWALRVDDLPDGFFPAYALGDTLGWWPDGTLLVDDGTYYLVWNSERWEISEAGLTANGWNVADAIPADTSGLAEGGSIEGEEARFADTAQLEHGENQSEGVVVSTATTRDTILQGESVQTLGTFTFSFAQTTTMSDPIVLLETETNQDNDADPGGLVRGDGSAQIEANLTNIRWLDASGTSLFSSAGLVTTESDDDSQRLQFSGDRTFAPGRHTVRIVADIPDGTPENEQYVVTLLLSETEFVSGRADATVSPTSLAGPTVSVQVPGIEVSLVSTDSSVVLRGSGTSEVLGLEFSNPLDETIRITKLVLTGYVDAGESEEDFVAGADTDGGVTTTVASLIDSVTLRRASDGTALGTSTNIGSDGTVRFENLAWQLGSDETFEIRVEVVRDAAGPFGLENDRVAFDLAQEAHLEAETLAGEELDVLGIGPNGGADPSVILTIAQSGSFTIEGSGGGESIVTMGSEDVSLYTFTFTADEVEDIIIDTLSLRLTNPTAGRSVETVELHYTQNGQSLETSTGVSLGNVTFDDLEIRVPKDAGSGTQELDVQVYVNVAGSSQGGVSGDELAMQFEPATFRAHGAVSNYAFDRDDFDDKITDMTSIGSASVVRRNEISISGPVEQISTNGDRDSEEAVFRFVLSATGEGTAQIQRLTFQIESSDVGTTLNDISADNDLFEDWADINGDAQDDNGVAELVDEETGHTIGEGSSGHVDFLLYDESARSRDETPAGLDTARGDYGILVYEFTTPITVYQAGREYTLLVNTSGLADDETHTIDVTLLDGSDFLWGDGTTAGDDLIGEDLSRLPLAGPTVAFD